MLILAAFSVAHALFFVAGAAWQRCRDLDRQLKEVDR